MHKKVSIIGESVVECLCDSESLRRQWIIPYTLIRCSLYHSFSFFSSSKSDISGFINIGRLLLSNGASYAEYAVFDIRVLYSLKLTYSKTGMEEESDSQVINIRRSMIMMEVPIPEPASLRCSPFCEFEA